MRLLALLLAISTPLLTDAAIAPLRRRIAPLTSTLHGAWFDVPVTIGNQTFMLLVDTGSSDTWVAATGYSCRSAINGSTLPQHDCPWTPTFDVPSDFEYIANQTFGVQYGTGISLGKVAYENVTLAGVSVPNQIIGIVDRTDDTGDGIMSGIMGLAYPALTSAHYGTSRANNSEALLFNRAIYNPLFVNMYKHGLINETWYSLALERPPKGASTADGGWLGLGELPPVNYSDVWAVAPIEITDGIPNNFYANNTPVRSLMSLTVDSVSWSSDGNATISRNETSFQAVVDSGNDMNQLPLPLASAINAAFDPAATWNKEAGIYLVACNATAPSMGIEIAEHTFWLAAEDLILQDPGTGACYSAVTRQAEGLGVSLSFLGDPFLRNVVAVFDQGKNEMRFAARTNGSSSNSTSIPPPKSSGSSPVYSRDFVWSMFGISVMFLAVGGF